MEQEILIGFSIQLIVMAVLVAMGVFQGLYLGKMGKVLDRTYEKMNADDAALFLQGRRVEDALKEMRDLLKAK